MTTTYDPQHPAYVDEADVRDELTRAFDVCHGCRACVELCTVFPTLFEMIDRHDDREAGYLTPADQDHVVDRCVLCTLCSVDCPYAPGRHECNLDIPRLMLRARAMQHANGITTIRHRMTTQVMGRTELFGRLATGPISNRIANAEPGSATRAIMSKVAGVSSVRLLPPYARQRFSTWFRNRPKPDLASRQGVVTVLPTCLVEYHESGIGKDLVGVYERNGIECTTTAARCCGAPWLHAGNVKEFVKLADSNVRTLAAEVRAGTDIVVPQPTCSRVIKHDYPDYVSNEGRRADAELVAAHTFDAAEYLVRLHTGTDTVLDTEFAGETVESITYHAPCHLRTQDIGMPSRELLELTGATVTLVQQCSGTGAMWGWRAGNEDVSLSLAAQLGEQIDAAGGDVVAGDCHLANTAIVEETGRTPQHPLQVLARAYGIRADG